MPASPIGFADHRPFSGFSDELVYGVAEDGGIIHVSSALRGLRCRCRCPACERVLVAKKGNKQAHHFAHHKSGVSCAKAAETNAHIWAKDVLGREKRLTIPEIFAEHAGRSELVSPAQTYEFVDTRLEKRLGTIVPDVVLITANGTELIVEVRVTHPCDEVKLEKLRSDRLSAIEIDLRQFRTSSNRQAVEEALLLSAPREWLSNAKQALFDERLRDRLVQEEKKKASKAEVDAKRTALAKERQAERAAAETERRARSLISALQNNRHAIRELAASVEDILKEFEDIPWSGMRTAGFRVDDRVWQAELVSKYLTYPNALDYEAYDDITVKDAMVSVGHYLLAPFRQPISDTVQARLRDEWPGLRLPGEAITSFLDDLVGSGHLMPMRSLTYRVHDEYARHLAEREWRRKAYERRLADLRQRVQSLIARLPVCETANFDLSLWEMTPLNVWSSTPEEMCRRGDEVYNDFERAFKRAELMCDAGPEIDQLVGLPLAGEVGRARNRERERYLQAAAARRKSLKEAAKARLQDEADAWLSAPSEDHEHLARSDFAGLDDLSYQRARAALERAAMARQAVIQARDQRIACQAELRKAGRRVYDDAHLDLFLRAADPRIGKSPLDHCVDKRTLQECLALLPPGRGSRRR